MTDDRPSLEPWSPRCLLVAFLYVLACLGALWVFFVVFGD